jgi:16S rRNA (adenine1518-N6/adenine1519-N6)-dimethyltransferase
MLREETLGLLGRFGVTVDPLRDEQHIVDVDIIRRMIDAAKVGANDTVLEVGAGAGNITLCLAERALKVYAIEKNPKFLPILRDRLGDHGNVEVIEGDALILELPEFDKVVSNLPYSISEALIQRLMRKRFNAASILVSSSFARILLAEKEEAEYSRLTFASNLFFDVRLVEQVPPSAYYPEPDKSTSLLTLRPKRVSSPAEAMMRGVILRGDKKLKNALVDAVIGAHSEHGTPSTKRAAKKYVERLEIGWEAEARVARLPLRSLESIFERLRSFT